MEDVLALYEKPLLEREPVVCVDEKPVVLHADLRPAFPMRPGRIARRDCEYKRCGRGRRSPHRVRPALGRHSGGRRRPLQQKSSRTSLINLYEP